MEKDLYELIVNEMFEHVLPPLQDTELEILTKEIVEEGCRDPLVVWNGIIVDGHNRYRICHEKKIPFSYIEKNFESEWQAISWIVQNQSGRRNLSVYSKCLLVLSMEDQLEEEGKRRQGWKTGRDDLLQNSAKGEKRFNRRELMAQMAGVSRDTIMKVKKLAEAVDEETKEKLCRAEISINKAYSDLMDLKEISSIGKNKHEPLSEKKADVFVKQEREILPGHTVGDILSPDMMGYERPSDSVYDKPPIEACGIVPADDLEFRGKTEMAHVRAELKEATEVFFQRAEEICRKMSDASLKEENLSVLRNMITDAYEQVMNLFTF